MPLHCYQSLNTLFSFLLEKKDKHSIFFHLNFRSFAKVILCKQLSLLIKVRLSVLVINFYIRKKARDSKHPDLNYLSVRRTAGSTVQDISKDLSWPEGSPAPGVTLLFLLPRDFLTERSGGNYSNMDKTLKFIH